MAGQPDALVVASGGGEDTGPNRPASDLESSAPKPVKIEKIRKPRLINL
jgi:hypothetical protein